MRSLNSSARLLTGPGSRERAPPDLSPHRTPQNALSGTRGQGMGRKSLLLNPTQDPFRPWWAGNGKEVRLLNPAEGPLGRSRAGNGKEVHLACSPGSPPVFPNQPQPDQPADRRGKHPRDRRHDPHAEPRSTRHTREEVQGLRPAARAKLRHAPPSRRLTVPASWPASARFYPARTPPRRPARPRARPPSLSSSPARGQRNSPSLRTSRNTRPAPVPPIRPSPTSNQARYRPHRVSPVGPSLLQRAMRSTGPRKPPSDSQPSRFVGVDRRHRPRRKEGRVVWWSPQPVSAGHQRIGPARCQTRSPPRQSFNQRQSESHQPSINPGSPSGQAGSAASIRGTLLGKGGRSVVSVCCPGTRRRTRCH
jgi:hypothetical protein